MSATPVFNKVSTGIYVLSTLSDAGLPGYWAGYYAGPDTLLGNSASTTQVWQDTAGFYLFLDRTPMDWGIFSEELRKLLPNFDPQNKARCVWIANASSDPLEWNVHALYAGYTGNGSTIVWTQLRMWSSVLGAYSIGLSGLSTLGYITDSNGGGITFTNGGLFTGPEGGYPFSTAAISFSGAALGCISSAFNAPVPQNESDNDLWTSLNIGLQYAAAPDAFSEDDAGLNTLSTTEDGTEAEIAMAGATQLLFMPVFMRQSTALSLGILFDPLNLLVSSRTSFSLFPPGGTPPVLDSYMRTTRGYNIQMKPLAASGKIPAARFVFGWAPLYGSTSNDIVSYHLSPDGAFQLSVQKPPSSQEDESVGTQVLVGLSALEYITLSGTDYMAVFQGGNPAFIPYVDPSSNTVPDNSKALTAQATTSYMNVLVTGSEPQSPVYYAQPREAPIFSGKGGRSDGVLNYNQMPAFTLTSDVQSQFPPVFPSGIYAGLTSALASLAREMENTSLAPARNYYIGKGYGVGSGKTESLKFAQRRLRSANDPLGVTPQGLIAELTPAYDDFDGLMIGNMPGTEYPTVDLTAVTGSFKEVLQSNQLFFVASNVDVLMSGTSVRYMLTQSETQTGILLGLGVPQSVIDAVYTAVNGATQPFDTENDFVTCIQAAAGNYLANFLYVGGILKVEMDGWTFQLSPRTWRTNTTNPTMMIAKFCNRSLIDLANDTSSWLWPEAATLPQSLPESQAKSWIWPEVSKPDSGWTYPGNTNPQPVSLKQTQTILLSLLEATNAQDATAAQLLFYKTVASDPTWNGFLFINAPVDIGEFPDDLKFLTAGIDLTQFYAHHVGFSQTPFTVSGGKPSLQQTAAFGLIDYNDKLDLYADESIAFGFKTMKLHARFANAALAEFSAEVELMLNQLLGSALTKQEAARGNNLIIAGSYQKVGGAPSYSFTLTGQNFFNGNYSAISSIEVLSVQLVNGGNPGSVNVLTTFILNGNFRFAEYNGFDMFSYGPGADHFDGFLSYSGLAIDMSFSMLAPTQQTFIVHESNTAFDIGASVARVSSLANNFPLVVTSLVASPNLTATEDEKPTGQTPEDMGFTSVSAPIDQTPMVPSWYGLLYTLDLGTFGALTGSVSFKIGIIVAWMKGPSSDSFPVYVGLRLPGISAIAGSFPLQGVLKLGFRSFQFETYYDKDEKLAYLLRMRRFALSVLVWSFPPGNADIVLFGQPGNPKGSIGWYAAYDSDEKKNSSSASSSGEAGQEEVLTTKQAPEADRLQRRMRSGRRNPRIG